MKRNVSLVQYESGSEPESERDGSPEREHEQVPAGPPPPKKRKLPALPVSLVPAAPVDNPALHQGRVRTTPHVEGQWAAYVYVPLHLERNAPLYKLLRRAVSSARLRVPSLHSIAVEEDGDGEGGCELHVSLTHPVYLQAHQRKEFKRSVKAIAKAHATSDASFATFAELTNDERTRTFLALEVGAGHDQFKAMACALSPTLTALRQKTFYEEPRFHVSFAWALLDRTASLTQRGCDRRRSNGSSSPTSLSPTPGPQPHGDVTPTPAGRGASDELPSEPVEEFPTIPRFPEDLVPALNKELGKTLVGGRVGVFRATELCVRIGKEVSRWKLQDG